MGDGADGAFAVIGMLLGLLVPQPFTELTVILLLVNPSAKLTVTVVSFTPGPLVWLIVAPGAADHA